MANICEVRFNFPDSVDAASFEDFVCPIAREQLIPSNVSFCRNNRVLYGFYGIR